LYADNSARYAETACIPRFTSQFYQKHSDRIVYGTDMGYTQEMFSNTFRILESSDEHFYASSSYHWHLAGLALPDAVLRKVYRENALRAFEHARKNA
jgi:predicted TIM-barrel fold metal-dependent hydrolase